MKVGDVMTPDIEVLNPDDSLGTAAQLMADLDLEDTSSKREQPFDRDDYRPRYCDPRCREKPGRG